MNSSSSITGTRLGMVTLLVHQYDEAIAFFTKRLNFRLLEDTPLTNSKRWVVVSPSDDSGMALLLARAANAEQRSQVGNQSGGRVFLFLYTNDFQADYQRYRDAGVRFVRAPISETYGQVAVFEDLYGNQWDLIEPFEATSHPNG